MGGLSPCHVTHIAQPLAGQMTRVFVSSEWDRAALQGGRVTRQGERPPIPPHTLRREHEGSR